MKGKTLLIFYGVPTTLGNYDELTNRLTIFKCDENKIYYSIGFTNPLEGNYYSITFYSIHDKPQITRTQKSTKLTQDQINIIFGIAKDLSLISKN